MLKKSKKKINELSIIIPAYNEENYLKNTILKLKDSLNKNIKYEIIVVNNNSTDKTFDVTKKLNVKCVFLKKRGIARARNFGVLYSKYEKILFLDADTLVNKKLIQSALKKINDNFVFVGSKIKFNNKINLLNKSIVDLWNFISVNFKLMAGSFMMTKKEYWKKVNGLDESLYISEEINFSKTLNKFANQNKLKKGIVIPAYPVITSSRKIDNFTFLETFKMLFPLILNPTKRFRNIKYCDFWYSHR